MDPCTTIIKEYDHRAIRAGKYGSRMTLSIGLFVMQEVSVCDGECEEYELLEQAAIEATNNATSSLRQVEKANLKFALDCNRGLIGLTATHVMVEVHNLALAFHAERALSMYALAMALTAEEAQKEAYARGSRNKLTKAILKDENGVPYNKCGAAIYWMRSMCSVFELAVNPAPVDCDPQLRLVSTKFGVPRLAAS